MGSNLPIITIIIATYNSERTLERTLISIRNQTIDQKTLEILIVDGGSTDKTLTLAKDFKCKIIKNPMVEPINAKYLGFLKAQGKYVIGLDHDEVFINTKSLEERLKIFSQDKRVKAIHSSGYITPDHSSPINYYINEFGDPFSFFIYRLTKDFRFFLPSLRKRYKVIHDDNNYILIKTSAAEGRLPLMEVLAAGGMVDKKFLMENFGKLSKDKILFLPNLLVHLLSRKPYIAVMKNDPLYHYSSENVSKYLKKLEWRIRNNIYFSDTTGAPGFLKREQYEGKKTTINKYIFIPYSFSILFPVLDALWLCVTRRNLSHLIHVPLSVFTATLIVYHYIKRSFGFYPTLTSYDGSSKILMKWH